MKTTFSRLFSMIAALLMLCLLITGVAFRFLMMSWVESEKHKSLSADASALADLAEAYDSASWRATGISRSVCRCSPRSERSAR